jgi:phosphoribosylaminoimidazole-succinocarboxamide synthase
MEIVLKTELSNLMYRGKVRDSYDLGDSMLLVASDRYVEAFRRLTSRNLQV